MNESTRVSQDEIEAYGLFDDGAMNFEAARAAAVEPDTEPVTDERDDSEEEMQ